MAPIETTAVAVSRQDTSRYDNAEVIATIKQTVCRGATDAQLRMFLEVCKSTGLNPFLKEIWYVAEKGIIMAARDGYLRVANENPMFDGIETRVERDDHKVPIKAVCTVWRKDRSHPVICEAYFNEYKKAGPVWQQYPSAMISKVAEVLALKRSFAINGVVSEEEMGQQYSAGSAEAAQALAQEKIAAMEQAKSEGKSVRDVEVTRDPIVITLPSGRAVPEELTEMLHRIAHDPPHFATVCGLMEKQLTERGGDNGALAYDNIATAFASKKRPKTADLQETVLDLFLALQTFPEVMA